MKINEKRLCKTIKISKEIIWCLSDVLKLEPKEAFDYMYKCFTIGKYLEYDTEWNINRKSYLINLALYWSRKDLKRFLVFLTTIYKSDAHDSWQEVEMEDIVDYISKNKYELVCIFQEYINSYRNK